MKNKFLIIFLNLLFAACSTSPIFLKESPAVYFSNVSPKPVTDIRCSWVGQNVLALPSLAPGVSRSQSFNIGGEQDFFGSVNISWNNSEGEAVEKNFVLRKEHLPNFSDSTIYSYVQIYFDQHDAEIITSDIVDLSGKTRKMDRLMKVYGENYSEHNPKNLDNALITVKPEKDRSIPNSVLYSY